MSGKLGACAVVVVLLFCGGVRAADEVKEKAVREFFKVTSFQQSYQRSVELIIDNHIKSNPGLAQFRPVLEQFFNKYLRWEVVEPKMVALYSESFTTDEVRELSAFFSTEAGKKWAQVQPDLVMKGAKIGQEAVQAHTDELRDMMNAQVQQLRAKSASSTPPVAPEE